MNDIGWMAVSDGFEDVFEDEMSLLKRKWLAFFF